MAACTGNENPKENARWASRERGIKTMRDMGYSGGTLDEETRYLLGTKDDVRLAPVPAPQMPVIAHSCLSLQL